jgi:hypothetical protein
VQGAPVLSRLVKGQAVVSHRGSTTGRDTAPFTIDNDNVSMRVPVLRNENCPVVISTPAGVDW